MPKKNSHRPVLDSPAKLAPQNMAFLEELAAVVVEQHSWKMEGILPAVSLDGGGNGSVAVEYPGLDPFERRTLSR